MKHFLLDTNICIYVINHRPSIVKERFRAVGIENIMISPITVTELYHGVLKSARAVENSKALGEFLEFLTVLPFGKDDAEEAGRIRTVLERSGRPIGPYDVLIAAQALVNEMILVTNNEREFKRVKGLTVENWTRPAR